MQILIEISEDAYKKLTQKSMLMSASAIDEAVDAVKKGIVIDEIKISGFENGWIPVTERLPDEYIPVHVTIKKDGERVVADSYFNAGSKTFVLDTYSDYAEDKVLAWMPWSKPDPWKGDAE